MLIINVVQFISVVIQLHSLKVLYIALLHTTNLKSSSKACHVENMASVKHPV